MSATVSKIGDIEVQDKELLFGVTEYLNESCVGFPGTVKTRLSDFMVNEVDLDGNVLHLTDVTIPSSSSSENPSFGVLPADVKEQIDKFIASTDRSVEISAPDDKDERRILHRMIEHQYPIQKLLRTPKRSESGAHVIEITRASSHSAAFRRQEATRKSHSDGTACNYIHCILYKENIDTIEAVNSISKFLRVPPNSIQYAGVKDKRAKTSQKISVRIRDPERLAKFKRSNIILGNYSFEKNPLRLGDLFGNRFTLAIRNIPQDSRQAAEKSVEKFSQNGFINYFGLQRFGTTDVATCDVGKSLIKSDWQSAVDLIMKSRPNEHYSMAECRKIYQETKNATKASIPLGRSSCVESFLLNGLSKAHQNDILSAIQNIPRNMRIMYVHSYQSYVWNLAASYRLKVLGTKPVPGDLVFKTSADKTNGSTKRMKKGEEVDEDVFILTEENVINYSLSDIVLPIPGYAVKFPETQVTQFIVETMEKDGLDLRNRHPIKDYSVSGGYRNLVTKPYNLQSHIKFCDKPDEDLFLSDADILCKRSLPVSDAPNGTFMALIVEFTLQSSSYATMAVRELMKQSSDYRVIDHSKGDNDVVKEDEEPLPEPSDDQLDNADVIE